MASVSSRRFFLLTYPRTGSNLLFKILAPDDQPSLAIGEKREYFFIHTMMLRMRQFQIDGKDLDNWTEEEKTEFMASYQDCFENLQNHVNHTEAQGKDVFVKEHAPWLTEPVADTKWVFGKESTQEEPWMVKTSVGQTRSTLNETVLPDEFLKTWLPTFLIRHPALAFPSIYRTTIDLEGPEAARKESRQHTLEMTLHASRTLYDWYTRHFNASESKVDTHVTWPVILDADDIMMEPQVVIEYSAMLGFDPTKLKFSWAPVGEEEFNKMSASAKRMWSTISTSAGIVQGKTSNDLDITEEAKKWKAEFSEAEGEQIEKWVRTAMPDYEYMRAKRLRPRAP